MRAARKQLKSGLYAAGDGFEWHPPQKQTGLAQSPAGALFVRTPHSARADSVRLWRGEVYWWGPVFPRKPAQCGIYRYSPRLQTPFLVLGEAPSWAGDFGWTAGGSETMSHRARWWQTYAKWSLCVPRGGGTDALGLQIDAPKVPIPPLEKNEYSFFVRYNTM